MLDITKFGALNTHSYEVTFGAGTLGVNLQSTRAGYGGYVDSFYRPPDGSILFAEQNGIIKNGDLVLEINNDDVSRIAISEIPKKIERAKRPLVIRFERSLVEYTFPEVACDPRKMPWFMQYLMETYGAEEAVQEQAKLFLWLECESFHENLINIPEGDHMDQEILIFKKFFRQESSFSVLDIIPENLRILIIATMSSMDFSGNGGAFTQSNTRINTSSILSLSSNKVRCGSHLLKDAQSWVEDDMSKGSFMKFSTSITYNRMIGYLRYSPPFVKMTLLDILKCDRKSLYFFVFLCQIKRHAALHCSNILKPKPEDPPEGTIGHAEEILRRAMACVYVLGLQDGRSGIEDLPMLTRLRHLLPEIIELPSVLTSPAPYESMHNNSYHSGNSSCSHSINTNGCRAPLPLPSSSCDHTYIETLNAAITLSVPLSDTLKYMAKETPKRFHEIKLCLHDLRLAMLRELSSELMPKFLAGKEFEILLWEVEAHRQFTVADKENNRAVLTAHAGSDDGNSNGNGMDSGSESEERSESVGSRLGEDMDESVSIGSLGSLGSIGGIDEDKDSTSLMKGIVPDGAVQRLLRKVNLPGTMTMHRAPLSLLDEAKDELRRKPWEAFSWLVSMDTISVKNRDRSQSLRRETSSSFKSENGASQETVYTITQELKINHIIPIGLDKGSTPELDHTLIPPTLPSFLVPNGKYVWDSAVDRTPPPSPRLFNLAVTTRDNMLLYVSALILYRRLVSSDLLLPELLDRTPPSHSSVNLLNDNDSSTFTIESTSSENSNISNHLISIASTLAASSNSTSTTTTNTNNNNNNNNNILRTPSKYNLSSPTPTPLTKTTATTATTSEGFTTPSAVRSTSRNGELLSSSSTSNFTSPRPFLGRIKDMALPPLSPIIVKGRAVVDNVLRSKSMNMSEAVAVAVIPADTITTSNSNSSGSQSTTDNNSMLTSSNSTSPDKQQQQHSSSSSSNGSGSLPLHSPKNNLSTRDNQQDTITNTNTTSNSSTDVRNETSTVDSLDTTTMNSKISQLTSSTSQSPRAVTGAGIGVAVEAAEGTLIETPLDVPNNNSNNNSNINSISKRNPFDMSFGSPLDFIRKGRSKEGLTAEEDQIASSGNNVTTSTTITDKDNTRDMNTGVSTTNSTSNVNATVTIGDKRVPYGYCLVSKIPSIDCLRLPLAILAKHDDIISYSYQLDETDKLDENATYNFPSPTLANITTIANNTSLTSAEDIQSKTQVALSLMEQEDVLRPLRHAASIPPKISTIPLVLRPGGAQDLDAEMIFRSLNPRNIVTILFAFMLEFKIAVVSSRLTSLTVLGELLKTLISPLRWSHIYVPVLPKLMSNELLQCPTPFFVGLLRENVDTSSVPADVCLLDLENDACRVPSALGKALFAGRRLARSLDQLMRPALFRCDDIDVFGSSEYYHSHKKEDREEERRTVSNHGGGSSVTSLGVPKSGVVLTRDIIRLCKSFLADILEGIEECSIYCVDHSELIVLFDEAMFINHKFQRAKYSELPADRPFLEQLMRTQCFSMCVASSILRRLNPDSRPPSRPSSPFVSIAPMRERDGTDVIPQSL